MTKEKQERFGHYPKNLSIGQKTALMRIQSLNLDTDYEDLTDDAVLIPANNGTVNVAFAWMYGIIGFPITSCQMPENPKTTGNPDKKRNLAKITKNALDCVSILKAKNMNPTKISTRTLRKRMSGQTAPDGYPFRSDRKNLKQSRYRIELQNHFYNAAAVCTIAQMFGCESIQAWIIRFPGYGRSLLYLEPEKQTGSFALLEQTVLPSRKNNKKDPFRAFSF